MFVNTEQRQDEIVKLRISELSPHGTFGSSPVENIPLIPEEMLPVVSDVGEDSSKTPHIGRGGDVTIVSSENLRSQVADGFDLAIDLGGAVVHGRGGLTCYDLN